MQKFIATYMKTQNKIKTPEEKTLFPYCIKISQHFQITYTIKSMKQKNKIPYFSLHCTNMHTAILDPHQSNKLNTQIIIEKRKF